MSYIVSRICRGCGLAFETGSASKALCSPECRVKVAGLAFGQSSSCWEWPGSRNPQSGYGQLSEWRDGRRYLHTAHRTSYRAFCGPIVDGLQVLHRCDNRACFNPGHLFLGTQGDNMQDMIAKGRDRKRAKVVREPKAKSGPRKGAAHYKALLTADDVRYIRSLSAVSLQGLAEQFGVSKAAIKGARYRQTWKHVT